MKNTISGIGGMRHVIFCICACCVYKVISGMCDVRAIIFGINNMDKDVSGSE